MSTRNMTQATSLKEACLTLYKFLQQKHSLCFDKACNACLWIGP